VKAVIRRYPNNEVRVAVFPDRLPKDYLKAGDNLSEDENVLPDCDSDHLLLHELSSEERGSTPTLDIKSKVDTPPRRLHMALSRYGRRQVLRAGSCFSMGEDSERLLLTGTLPGSTMKAFQALAEFSTYATKTLCNWLTRREPGCKWLYCWEFQGRGALHLHLVCEVSLSNSQYIKASFRDEWDRILRSIGKFADTNLYQKTETYFNKKEDLQVDVTVCDREPSRYVSKYVSKSSTSAKGFNRFPPRQWFQVSRSLLRSLREKTETFEVEGLSYRQARCCIEDAIHALSSCAISGWRRFEGVVLSWSGYGYENGIQVTDFGERFMKKGQSLLSTRVMCSMTRSVLKEYPENRAAMMAATHKETLTLMEKGLLSETEMLMYIETAMRSLMATLMTTPTPTRSAMHLTTAMEWWEDKFGYRFFSQPEIDQINKICEGDLTHQDVRTKSRFEELKLF